MDLSYSLRFIGSLKHSNAALNTINNINIKKINEEVLIKK